MQCRICSLLWDILIKKRHLIIFNAKIYFNMPFEREKVVLANAKWHDRKVNFS